MAEPVKPPPKPRAWPAALMRIGVVLAWLAVPLGVAAVLLLLMDDALRQTVLGFLAFGAWSGGCVMFGVRVARHRQVMTMQAQANAMFHWIRTGKDKPNDGADDPPVQLNPQRRATGGAPL